ncbi:BON domain-containing protein [Piscinibacter sp. XHJ-5]|uniref:BON domain-containing protein n=1 Tax=Piscinibacter sp. XHJ-5 TaxID=3037797 RepID=UPI0024536BE1|nr:BON domain-containing protein [Piscinibacter sp. XHJ-5]
MKSIYAWTVAFVALALGACDNRTSDGTTVGQKVDQGIATAQTAATEAKQSAKRSLDEAAQVSQEKSQVLAEKVGDAAITASIKAGIAKDPELSALRINVDTRDGKVALYGSAPSEAARQRAQTIAQNEKGVTGVENKVAVESK